MATICNECWNDPCVCGKNFSNLSESKLLLLIDALTGIAKTKGLNVATTIEDEPIKQYLLRINRNLSYKDNTSLLSLLEMHQFSLATKYMELVKRYSTAEEVYNALASSTIPFKSAFAIVLHRVSLDYTDTKLDRFLDAVIKKYTVVPYNEKMVAMLQKVDDHKAFQEGLWQINQQRAVIVAESLIQDMDPNWLLAWAILHCAQYISIETQTTALRFKYLVSVIKHLSLGITESNAIYEVSNFSPDVLVNNTNNGEYGEYELIDDELFELINQVCGKPYFGTLPSY